MNLKIVPRKGKDNFREKQGRLRDAWTSLLIEMAKMQIEAIKAGQKSARPHLLAILKELEYHCGFRYIQINDDYPNDPRK